MRRTRHRGITTGTALVAAAVLALAGCGGDGDGGATEGSGSGGESTSAPQAPEATGGSPTSETSSPEGQAAAGGATVQVAPTSLGEVLVDGEGMVLYMFDPDAQGESTCYDQCAQAWPPLLAEGEATAGEGVEESRLGTVPRTDGSQQVTYNDWPLYYFARDAGPGETTGQAVNGVWWVLDPQGEPIRS